MGGGRRLAAHRLPRAAPRSAAGNPCRWRRTDRATLAVIDPLFRMFDFPDGNDYAAVTASTAPLIELAEATGCALVFIHHSRKGSCAKGEEALGQHRPYSAPSTR